MLIAEPVQNRGGCITPPDGYWQGLRALADRYGFLLVADEVITAFGRLGEWFGGDRYGARPDIVTVAKGLTAGYAPMGATLVGHPGRRGDQPAGRGPQPRLHLRRPSAERGARPAQPATSSSATGSWTTSATCRTTWPNGWRTSARCRSSATSAAPGFFYAFELVGDARGRRLQRHRPRRARGRPHPAPAARGRAARPRLQPRRPAGADRAPADQRPRSSSTGSPTSSRTPSTRPRTHSPVDHIAPSKGRTPCTPSVR